MFFCSKCEIDLPLIWVARNPDNIAHIFASDKFNSFFEPLLTAHHRTIPKVALKSYCGLIFTSANAVHSFAQQCEDGRELAVWAVGDATAAAARGYGFARVFSAHAHGGTARDLIEMIKNSVNPRGGNLLYLAGEVTAIELDLELSQYGYMVDKLVTYHTEAARSLSFQLMNFITTRKIKGIALFSPRAAEALSALVHDLELGRFLSEVHYFCLSNQVGDQVGNQVGNQAGKSGGKPGGKNAGSSEKQMGKQMMHISPQPNIQALVTKIQEVLMLKKLF